MKTRTAAFNTPPFYRIDRSPYRMELSNEQKEQGQVFHCAHGLTETYFLVNDERPEPVPGPIRMIEQNLERDVAAAEIRKLSALIEGKLRSK